MQRKNIPTSEIKISPEAQALIDSPQMKIYVDLIQARMQGADDAALIEQLSSLPIEERYTWRVVSALMWAFADFDTECVKLDLETLPLEDIDKLVEALKIRPVQFCMFLRALVGAENMERLMKSAIDAAKHLD